MRGGQCGTYPIHAIMRTCTQCTARRSGLFSSSFFDFGRLTGFQPFIRSNTVFVIDTAKSSSIPGRQGNYHWTVHSLVFSRHSTATQPGPRAVVNNGSESGRRSGQG